jgi:hypothetical protein
VFHRRHGLAFPLPCSLTLHRSSAPNTAPGAGPVEALPGDRISGHTRGHRSQGRSSSRRRRRCGRRPAPPEVEREQSWPGDSAGDACRISRRPPADRGRPERGASLEAACPPPHTARPGIGRCVDTGGARRRGRRRPDPVAARASVWSGPRGLSPCGRDGARGRRLGRHGLVARPACLRARPCSGNDPLGSGPRRPRDSAARRIHHLIGPLVVRLVRRCNASALASEIGPDPATLRIAPRAMRVRMGSRATPTMGAAPAAPGTRAEGTLTVERSEMPCALPDGVVP